MKHRIAKFFMWCLRVLDYQNQYSPKNNVRITADVSQAVKELKRMEHQVNKLQKGLDKLNETRLNETQKD